MESSDRKRLVMDKSTSDKDIPAWVTPSLKFAAVVVVCGTVAYGAKQFNDAKVIKVLPSAISALGGLFN